MTIDQAHRSDAIEWLSRELNFALGRRELPPILDTNNRLLAQLGFLLSDNPPEVTTEQIEALAQAIACYRRTCGEGHSGHMDELTAESQFLFLRG